MVQREWKGSQGMGNPQNKQKKKLKIEFEENQNWSGLVWVASSKSPTAAELTPNFWYEPVFLLLRVTLVTWGGEAGRGGGDRGTSLLIFHKC